MIEPRFAWVPPCARSLGAECIEFWRAAGGSLFEWQERVIVGILGLDEDERWASSEDAVDVARQNGKGVILQAIETFVAFELGHRLEYDLIMHTAHEFATSQDHQLRLEAFIQDAPHLHARVKERGGYMHANGRESINLKDGTRIAFKARTKGGGRGWSGDLLVWDEAMIIPDTVVGAQKPMLRASTARYGSKVVYAGSAVDKQIHEHGVNFARIRKRGIAQDPRVSYHEWSAPYDDPEQLTADLLRDRSLWPLGNPSMADGLIAEDTMADEIESTSARTVAVELFGVGDWPAVDEKASGLFDMKVWEQLAVPDSEMAEPTLAFDVSPLMTWGSIGAGRRFGDSVRVKLVDRQEGTGWLTDRLVDLAEELRPASIMCDEKSAAASLVPELEAAGLKIEMINTGQYADACGMFFRAFGEGSLEHVQHPALDAAVRGASQRPLGEEWAWSRKHSKADITPLVACTIAHFIEAGRRYAKKKLVAVAFG